MKLTKLGELKQKKREELKPQKAAEEQFKKEDDEVNIDNENDEI